MRTGFRALRGLNAVKSLSPRERTLILGILGLLVLLTAKTPFIFERRAGGGVTFSLDALRLLLDNYASTFIAAVGMTVVIVAGQLDLSVGSSLALCAVSAAWASSTGLPLPIVVALPIVIGTTIGIVNGAIVAYGGMHSLIVTLGMMTLLRGVVIQVVPVGWLATSDRFKALGTTRFLGVALPVWVAIVFAIALVVLVRRTRLGRDVYAVGSNPDAAQIMGISPARIRFLTLAFSGFAIGLASAVHASRFGIIQNSIGQGFELLVITTVVIGGTSIFGGSGTIKGTLLGVFAIALIRSSLVYFHVPALWEQVVYGALLLVAVGVDAVRSRRLQRIAGVPA